MAARGARSRKVVEKVITKEENKRHENRFNSLASPGLDASRVTSPVAGWRRKESVANSGASVHSGESMSSGKLSSTGAKLASKISNMTPNEQEKFVAKGKTTHAPRGRGGGVPMKTIEARRDRATMRSVKSGRSIHSSQGFRPASRATLNPDLSSSRTRSWENTKVWTGGIAPPKPYQGFENDDDLWMSDGNCLIFFAEETNEDDPRPMCRVHTQTLEQAHSLFMINLLRYGEIVLDEDEHDFNPPSNNSGPSSPSSPTYQHTWPLMNDKSLGNLDELLHDESTLNMLTGRSPPMSPAQNAWDRNHNMNPVDPHGRRPLLQPLDTAPPPAFGANPAESHTPSSGAAQITHEIWFRAPSHITRPDIQRRHHMATRNYLALLYGLPLIGNDYYEMLSDLQNVMETYYELNEPSERWDTAQVIMQYLTQRQLDDIRGNLSAALGLMAWSEQASVRWEAGYLEGFVHTVGMMSPKTSEMREFRILSQVSKHKLQNAYNAHQLRVIEAEERLSSFDFPELWYAEGVDTAHAAQRGFDAFREFLGTFYATVWGDWPPKETDHQGRWLTRSMVNRLQADLGALYDYIVDRDIKWDVSEERHTRKWEMISQVGYRGGSFKADFPGLPVTNMLVGFDSSLRYDHIPHPFPLLPKSSAIVKEKSSKKGLFGKFSSKKETTGLAGPKEQYQMALAFNAATNIDRLGTAFKENKLLDTFQTHEKSFLPSVLPPADARLGRWILLYALLQVLSSLSVDVLGLKYTEKIRYFACPGLEGLPPWRTPQYASTESASPSGAYAPLMREARQGLSYCWLAPARWARGADSSGAITPTPPAYEMQAPPDAMTMPTLRHANSANNLNPTELDGRSLTRQRNLNKSPAATTSPHTHAFSAKESPKFMHASIVSSPVYGAGSPLLSPRVTSPPQLLTNEVHLGGLTPHLANRNLHREKVEPLVVENAAVRHFGMNSPRPGFL